MPRSKLPDRWENYSNIGGVIAGTRIVTFKVPLNEHLCSHYPDELWFTPNSLVQTSMKNGQALGLIIDLTFTRRYYDPQVFIDKGIDHKKIFVPGKEVPSPAIVEEFCDAIDKFTSGTDNDDKLVGVHCTHGVNRTGHLVCRYMIDRLNIDPEEAIKAYGEARGYPIERENYLADLRGIEGEISENPAKAQDEPDVKKMKYDSHHKHRHSQDSGNSGSRWTDSNRHSDYRGNGYGGGGRGQHGFNSSQNEHRNGRSHSGNYPREERFHKSARNNSNNAYSQNSWGQGVYDTSSNYGYGGYHGNDRYHYGNYGPRGGHHANSYGSHRGGSYYSRNDSWNSHSYNGGSDSRNSYNQRKGQDSSGGWSLSRDSDYGNFGYSNRSQGQGQGQQQSRNHHKDAKDSHR